MEEIQSQSDNYRSSASSSASSPVRFTGLGIDDTDVDVRVEDSKDNNIAATTAASHSGYLSSPPQPEEAVVARNISGDSIVWKDLTVAIKGKRKYSDRVIKSSNGYALPGTMTVIMGPRKSGKSTLLRALAGKLDGSANMFGEVFVNGAKSSLHYGSYLSQGFVERTNTLIGSLTVREYLYYSALLQLPGFLCEKKNVVEDAIAATSLCDYANNLIGGHCCTKGLSNGEKRRVSIARELVMGPHFFVSAQMMMVTLKKLANTGCTLIFTIYQSSTEVFGLFDRICLLSNGKTLFFGETLACLQHFSNAGFPCPIMQSPSDHFLRAINTEFDRIISVCKSWQDDHGDLSSVNMDTHAAICTLEETYKSSADAAAVETMILRLTETEGPSLRSKGTASSATRITAKVAAIFTFISFSSLLSIFGVPAQLKEVKVYACEDSNKHSGGFVFLTGLFLASIPFLFLISISSSLVFCFFTGLRNEFNYLMYFVVNFFICLLVNEGLVLVVVTILQDIFWSIVILVFMHVMMMLSAGYFRIRSALPGPVWMYPMSYIAFHTYTIQVHDTLFLSK
ncbi:hypothetical protein L1987_81857 [Smallanthus sonchifolius]|uniref:Uncharacterized protein n=1 Tax=Smallanthus sonchifolius TaxID=185202 RepID=A0ACB8YS87_9ASTR|nr:hypothetical protein L1987_81857 [Smallanthus sonchifolius]